SGQVPGHTARVADDWIVALGTDRCALHVEVRGASYMVRGADWEASLATDWQPGDLVMSAAVDGKTCSAQIERNGPLLRLSHAGASLEALAVPVHLAAVIPHLPVKAPPDLGRYLLSPMPGLLISLAVQQGEEVKAGQELAIVEAMKMENVLRAERDGRIARLHASAGANLAVDQPILEFE